METIKQVLMKRDNMTGMEADELILQAKKTMQEYLAYGDTEAAYDICKEYFSLEPDYLMELL